MFLLNLVGFWWSDSVGLIALLVSEMNRMGVMFTAGIGLERQ